MQCLMAEYCVNKTHLYENKDYMLWNYLYRVAERIVADAPMTLGLLSLVGEPLDFESVENVENCGTEASAHGEV
jgi:hypothetical protein